MEGCRIRNKELSSDHNHRAQGQKGTGTCVMYPSNNNNQNLVVHTYVRKNENIFHPEVVFFVVVILEFKYVTSFYAFCTLAHDIGSTLMLIYFALKHYAACKLSRENFYC